MKVSITYRAEETKAAKRILRFAERVLPPSRVRKSDRYAPFLHLYLSTKKPKAQGETGEILDTSAKSAL